MAEQKIRYSFVVARSRNFVIGCENRLPWHLPTDLLNFKLLTEGKPVIMGRRTFDSIGRVLPGRPNIVISRENGINDQRVIVVPDKTQAMERAKQEAQRLGTSEVMVIGGEQIFRLFQEEVTRVYLTEVHAEVEGDAYFRDDFSGWTVVDRRFHSRQGTRDDFDYNFVELVRPTGAGHRDKLGVSASHYRGARIRLTRPLAH